MTLAIALAGCNGTAKTGSTTGPDAGASTTAAGSQRIHRDPANRGKTVTVGANRSPEEAVLGEVYAQALVARGYKVKERLDLGPGAAFKGLRQGSVDGYPEYVDTALTSFYKVPVAAVPKDAGAAYGALRSKLAADKLTALAPTPFERTYRLGLTQKMATKLGGPTKISDLVKASDLTVTGNRGCARRPDCLLGVEKGYGLKFKKFVAGADPYRLLARGVADVAFVHATDAALAANGYVVLDDDKHVFPPSQVSFLVKPATLSRLGPDARQVIEKVQTPLTIDVQRELNARVVIDGKTPRVVAAEYLRQAGFVK
jgi:glycine betaine/choline ABC-type transport system substrate-binding protein